MKCQECVEAGERSKVFDRGVSRTLMGGSSHFYDEDGQSHYHEVNATTAFYSCSNGHQWATRYKPICPNSDCDYGGPVE
jgi:hypothetical protein